MNTGRVCDENEVISTAQPSRVADADSPKAWEQIETGRYQPRRIRGSLRGRELG